MEWAGNWISFVEGAHFQRINARNIPFKNKEGMNMNVPLLDEALK